MLLSMVLITVEGDITEDSGDPVDPQKIAFSRAEREKTCFQPLQKTRAHTHKLTETNTHIYRDLNLPPSLLLCLPRAFLCVSTHLRLHSSL